MGRYWLISSDVQSCWVLIDPIGFFIPPGRLLIRVVGCRFISSAIFYGRLLVCVELYCLVEGVILSNALSRRKFVSSNDLSFRRFCLLSNVSPVESSIVVDGFISPTFFPACRMFCLIQMLSLSNVKLVERLISLVKCLISVKGLVEYLSRRITCLVGCESGLRWVSVLLTSGDRRAQTAEGGQSGHALHLRPCELLNVVVSVIDIVFNVFGGGGGGGGDRRRCSLASL